MDAKHIRRRLKQELHSDSDFAGFCHDCFPEAYHRFGNAMDRVCKTTILLELNQDYSLIAQKLEEYITDRDSSIHADHGLPPSFKFGDRLYSLKFLGLMGLFIGISLIGALSKSPISSICLATSIYLGHTAISSDAGSLWKRILYSTVAVCLFVCAAALVAVAIMKGGTAACQNASGLLSTALGE